MKREANLRQLWNKPDGYFQQHRSEMLDYIPESVARVLDVGCGEGGFGAKLRETFQAEVWGIEIDEHAAQIARENLDRVIVGDISTILTELPKSYFSCVVFNDVLEHLLDPYYILEQTIKCLEPEGTIVCSVPNVRYFTVLYRLFIEKSWRYSDSGVMDKTHLRFFTIRSMRDTLIHTGYKVVKIEGINPTRNLGAQFLRFGTFGWLGDCKYPQIACVAQPQ